MVLQAATRRKPRIWGSSHHPKVGALGSRPQSGLGLSPPVRHKPWVEIGSPGAGGSGRVHAGPESVFPVVVAGPGAGWGEGRRPVPPRAQVTSSRATCGAAGGAPRGGWRPCAFLLYPPVLTVQGPGGEAWGAARVPSRQVWLGGLSQALIRACPPLGVEEGGNGSEPDSFSQRVAGGRGPLGSRSRAAGQQASPARGLRWQHVAPGRRGLGGSIGVAVAGPYRRPNVLCTKAFSGRPERERERETVSEH